jgi:2-iminobutanoate/2-iminopropanoate deaminase
MVKKMPTHCGDDSCVSCIVVGDYSFFAYRGDGHDVNAPFESIKYTSSTVNAILDDIVQINFYTKK